MCKIQFGCKVRYYSETDQIFADYFSLACKIMGEKWQTRPQAGDDAKQNLCLWSYQAFSLVFES